MEVKKSANMIVDRKENIPPLHENNGQQVENDGKPAEDNGQPIEMMDNEKKKPCTGPYKRSN